MNENFSRLGFNNPWFAYGPTLPRTPVQRNPLLAPLPPGYQTPNGMPQGELYPSGQEPGPQQPNPLLTGGPMPQMPFTAGQSTPLPPPRSQLPPNAGPQMTPALPSDGFSPIVPPGIATATPPALRQQVTPLAAVEAPAAAATAPLGPQAVTVREGPFMGPLNTSGAGRPIVSDAPNPDGFTPSQSGLPSFMSIPDRTYEQRLNDIASNFTNDYIGMNGQVIPTRNADRRMAANNLLAEIQQGRDRIGVEDRRTAAGERSDAARLAASAQENNLRAATALVEGGLATSLEDALGMVNTAQGTPAANPLTTGQQQPGWRQHRTILDDVAGITRRGPITSAPTVDNIAEFVRSVRDRYPGTDLSGVLDEYIAAHWPAEAVQRYRGRTPTATIDEYRRPQRQRELREAGLMVPGTVTGPGEGFGGMGGGW